MLTGSGVENDPKIQIFLWCNEIVGPFIIQDTKNAERYLIMPQNQVWPNLSTWNNFDNFISMQDGTPPHFALERPPKSHISHSMIIFFLWDGPRIKSIAKPNDLDQSQERVHHLVSNVPLNFLRSSDETILKLLEKLVNNSSRDIEF